VHGVELAERFGEVGVGLGGPGADEDGEELSVEAAGAHLREVDLHVGLQAGEVNVVVPESLGAVGVGVDDDDVMGEGQGGGYRRRRGEKSEEA